MPKYAETHLTGMAGLRLSAELYLLTRCTRGVQVVFSEQECDLVVVLVCINLTLPLRKSCSVHMTVFLKLLFIAMLTNGHNH